MSSWIADYVHAYSTHDAEAATRFMAEDAVYEDVGGGAILRGREAILRYYVDSYRYSSDVRSVIISQQQSGNQFAFEWEMEGTNDGEFGSLSATNKRFKLRGVTVGEHVDGKFTIKRDYYNLADMLSQLGILPKST
jgi:steroid delta-isomerase-like uncharacterized protein